MSNYWCVRVSHVLDDKVVSSETAETDLRLHQFINGDVFGIQLMAKEAYWKLKRAEREKLNEDI